VTTGRFDALFRWLRPLAFLAAAVGLFIALWAQRRGVAEFPWRISWLGFVLAVPAFTVGPIVGATSFWLIARAITGETRFVPCTQVWMRSFLARYVPSGALTLAVRLGARDRIGASAGQVVAATIYEQLAAVLGGATAASVALLAARRQPPLLAASILVALAAAVLLLPAVLARVDRARLLLRPSRLVSFPRRAVAAAALLNCGGWLLTGTAGWILVSAMVSSAPSFPFIVGAYAFAWLLGFVIVFAPSGLGVREATLVALLAPRFGAGPATAIALVLRFANIVGELVAFGAIELVTRLWSRPAVSGPKPTTMSLCGL
jgi:glycosyltransferase 2 family protein